jgi:hypothetical protein
MEQPKHPNKGEQSEVIAKQLLFNNKNNAEFLSKLWGGAEGIEIIDPATNAPYIEATQIKKAKSGEKADLLIRLNSTIKLRYISIKSKTGALPSILNHTPRSARVFQTDLQPYLADLDRLAAEYISKRTAGLIGEDIPFGALDSSKEPTLRDSFSQVLSYFVFTGTGSRRSPNECDSLLFIQKDNSLQFLDCDTVEKKNMYIRANLDTCVISFRHKGMPRQINESCLPWIYKNAANGKSCGSLHVRL